MSFGTVPPRWSGRSAPLGGAYRETPLWWDDTSLPSGRAVAPVSQADVVVVGAGYTGVAAALRLARHGKHVVLLDAAGLGEGASGRNAGMIHAGLRRDVVDLERRHGPAGRALHDASVDAYAFVARTAADDAPDAHWSQCGWLHLAHRASRMRALRRSEEMRRRRLGEATVMLESGALEKESPCRGFHGAMLTDNGASVHPMRFLAALVRLALGAGVELHERTAVTTIETDGAGLRVSTAHGEVRAGEVLVATNGYTGVATPQLRRRIIPIGSYIITTEPLGAAGGAAVSPRRRMMSDTRNFLHYWRLTPDGRLLFGGRTSFRSVSLERARDRLYGAMVDMYPQLAGVPVSHAWTGSVGFTFDSVPHLGRIDGVTYAMGYCGSGVAMGSWLGTLAGEWMAGGAAPAFAGLRFPTLPGYRGRPWFLPLAGWYYSLRDRV